MVFMHEPSVVNALFMALFTFALVFASPAYPKTRIGIPIPINAIELWGPPPGITTLLGEKDEAFPCSRRSWPRLSQPNDGLAS